MSLEKLPELSTDLIKALSKLFPDSYAVPSPALAERKIWIRVGERKVVAMLERLLEEATKFRPDQKVIKE